MIRKSTLSLIIILGVLVLMAYFLKQTRWWNTDTEVLPTATNSPMLINLSDKSITAFDMSDEQGRNLKAYLDKQNTWIIEQPIGCQYPSDSLSSSLSLLQTFKVLVSLETSPALADVGLTKPAYRLVITLNDGSTQTLKVGSLVPTGTGYYVQMNNDSVVVISKNNIDTLFGLVSTACATPTPEPSATPGPELIQPVATVDITSTPKP
jgi:hypothetical protein